MALTRPGALDARLRRAQRAPIFVGLSQGDAQAMQASRQLRWYDALALRRYQLEAMRRHAAR